MSPGEDWAKIEIHATVAGPGMLDIMSAGFFDSFEVADENFNLLDPSLPLFTGAVDETTSFPLVFYVRPKPGMALNGDSLDIMTNYYDDMGTLWLDDSVRVTYHTPSVDLDYGDGTGDDSLEETEGYEVELTDPGLPLPDIFPAGTIAGKLLTVTVQSDVPGSLFLELTGYGAAVYQQDASTGDWHRVIGPIPVEPVAGSWSQSLMLHTNEDFSRNVLIDARFYLENHSLYKKDRIKIFPPGGVPFNNPPEFQDEVTPGNYQFTLGEGSQIDLPLGEVTATDGDGDPLLYEITSGNDYGYFRIDVDANQRAWLTVAKDLPVESTADVYVLNIEVNDANGGKDTSTVTITTKPLVVITGDLHGAETVNPTDTITLTFVRSTKDKTNPLVVKFSYDVGLNLEVIDAIQMEAGQITIPAGQDRISITLEPTADGQPEGAEKFRVTLTPDPGYVLGSKDVIVDKYKNIESKGQKEVDVWIMDAARLFAPFNPILRNRDLDHQPKNVEPLYNDPRASEAGPPLDAGVSLNDINQGYVGDCYFMAAIGAIALRDREMIRGMFDLSIPGKVRTHFFPTLGGMAQTVTVDFTLDRGAAQAEPSGDDSDANNEGKGAFTEAWPIMLEKLYAQFTGVTTFYSDDGWVYEVWQHVYNVQHFKVKASDITEAEREDLIRTQVAGKLVVSIKSKGPGKGDWEFTNSGGQVTVTGNHAYVIMKIDDKGPAGNSPEDEVYLYNPWDSSRLVFVQIKDLRKIVRYIYHD